LKYFPIGNKVEAALIRGLSFLKPESRIDPRTYELRVLNVGKKLSTVISVEDHARLSTEVRRFVIDQNIESRIDKSANLTQFWLQLKDDGKYPLLSKLACVGLCLPHGNAESERILKQLANNLTPERSCLKELTIHSIIVSKSTMNAYLWRADNMPVTPSLLEKGFNARHSYQMRLKQEREKREREQREKAEIAITEAAKKQLEVMKKSREESTKILEKKKEEARKAISTAQEMLRTAGKDLAMIEKKEKRIKERAQEHMVSKAVKRALTSSSVSVAAKISKNI
jgi:hypothetical protein